VTLIPVAVPGRCPIAVERVQSVKSWAGSADAAAPATSKVRYIGTQFRI
jgi:hypothetical protein